MQLQKKHFAVEFISVVSENKQDHIFSNNKICYIHIYPTSSCYTNAIASEKFTAIQIRKFSTQILKCSFIIPKNLNNHIMKPMGKSNCNIHMFIHSLVKINIQNNIRKNLSLSEPVASTETVGLGLFGSLEGGACFAVVSDVWGLVATGSGVSFKSFFQVTFSLDVICFSYFGCGGAVLINFTGRLLGFFSSVSTNKQKINTLHQYPR